MAMLRRRSDLCRREWQDFFRFDHPMSRSPDFLAPPGLFMIFVANKALSLNRPLGLPCATLGSRLGGPWVAQGWPKPNPNRQRVASFAKYQIPLTKYRFFVKDRLPPRRQRTLRKHFQPLTDYVDFSSPLSSKRRFLLRLSFPRSNRLAHSLPTLFLDAALKRKVLILHNCLILSVHNAKDIIASPC
jgi:hypothetical protein